MYCCCVYYIHELIWILLLCFQSAAYCACAHQKPLDKNGWARAWCRFFASCRQWLLVQPRGSEEVCVFPFCSFWLSALFRPFATLPGWFVACCLFCAQPFLQLAGACATTSAFSLPPFSLTRRIPLQKRGRLQDVQQFSRSLQFTKWRYELGLDKLRSPKDSPEPLTNYQDVS